MFLFVFVSVKYVARFTPKLMLVQDVLVNLRWLFYHRLLSAFWASLLLQLPFFDALTAEKALAALAHDHFIHHHLAAMAYKVLEGQSS